MFFPINNRSYSRSPMERLYTPQVRILPYMSRTFFNQELLPKGASTRSIIRLCNGFAAPQNSSGVADTFVVHVLINKKVDS